MKLRLFGILGAIGCVAFGQTGTVAGPSAGYVFDPAVKAVRQIRGIPGAATLGDAIDLGIAASAAAVSPRGDLAAVTADDGTLHLFRLNNGTAVERPVNNLMTGAFSVRFSPSGTAAALYQPGSVQVLRGLPDAPVVAATFPAPQAADAVMVSGIHSYRVTGAAIAVSDDGAYVLFGRAGAIDLLSATGGRKLADAHAGFAVAFAPGSHDAAVVTGGTLSVFQDVAGASTRRDFPGATATSGLAFSADGGKVLLAGPEAVTVLDRATGDRKLAGCDCRIVSVAPMGTVFRLNELGSGPLWLLDPTATEPKVLFVPARSGL